ncbi:MAG: zinc ABC transporter substrate-binding protein [Archaeoglobaceae archaeon]
MWKGNTAIILLLLIQPATAYVVVTIPDLESVASAVCGCEVFSLSVADPHSYSLSASDYELLQNAELIVLANSRLLGFERKIKEEFENVLDVEDYGIEFEDCAGYEDNPHGYWMRPENVIAIARAIKNELSRLHPERAAEYEENFESFRSLVEKASEAAREIAGIEGKKFVALVPAMCYVVSSLGGEVESVLFSEAATLSTPELEEVKRMLKSGEVAAIVAPEFARNMRGGSLAESLAAETGSEVVYVEFSTEKDYVVKLLENAAEFEVKRCVATDNWLVIALSVTCLAEAFTLVYLGVRR